MYAPERPRERQISAILLCRQEYVFSSTANKIISIAIASIELNNLKAVTSAISELAFYCYGLSDIFVTKNHQYFYREKATLPTPIRLPLMSEASKLYIFCLGSEPIGSTNALKLSPSFPLWSIFYRLGYQFLGIYKPASW